MTRHPYLFWYVGRALFWRWVLVLGAGWTLYGLFREGPMLLADGVPFLVVGAIVFRPSIDRLGEGGRRFLETRGFRRPAVVRHGVAASVVAGVAAVLPVALVTWTWFRCLFRMQNGSPYFPTFAGREMWVPLVWLAVGATTPALVWRLDVALRRLRPVVGIGIAFLLVASVVGWLLLTEDHDWRRQQPVRIVVQLADSAAPGEVCVNGVNLGPAPVVSTYVELQRRVPRWSRPPAAGTWIELPETICSSDYEEPLRLGPWYLQVRRDGRVLPAAGTRVAFVADDRWQQATGERLLRLDLAVDLPARRAALAALLAQARGDGFRVSPPWCLAMDEYGADGWVAVQRAALEEPEALAVLGPWAEYRYHLGGVRDADAAWEVFTAICEEADETQRYETDSPAAVAVERLAPLLDAKRLVAMAVDLLATRDTAIWQEARRDASRPRFAYYLAGPVVRPNLPSRMVVGPERRALPPHGYVVAHAVWCLHRHLEATGVPYPNIVQRRVMRAVVRCHWQTNALEELARTPCFGGPAVDRLVLNHPSDSVDAYHRDGGLAYGVDRWLYLKAVLPTPAGRRWRAMNEHRVESLCRYILAQVPEGAGVPDDLLLVWQRNPELATMLKAEEGP